MTECTQQRRIVGVVGPFFGGLCRERLKFYMGYCILRTRTLRTNECGQKSGVVHWSSQCAAMYTRGQSRAHVRSRRLCNQCTVMHVLANREPPSACGRRGCFSPEVLAHCVVGCTRAKYCALNEPFQPRSDVCSLACSRHNDRRHGALAVRGNLQYDDDRVWRHTVVRWLAVFVLWQRYY